MNTLTALLKSPAAVDLGWSLLHFIWQGTVLAGLCALAWRRLRFHPAQVRYLVGCLCLLLMASAPVLTYASLAKRHASRESSWIATESGAVVSSAEGDKARRTGRSGNAILQISRPESPSAFANDAILAWLVALWLAGVTFLSGRLLIGWLLVQRLKRNQVSEPDPAWMETLSELKRRAKMHRTIRLCRSALAEVPMVIGWLKPVILLPAGSLIGLTPPQLEAILAHELAHIARYDYLVNLLQSLVETLLFYHPAVWWISKRVRDEREHCCDDAAVILCGNRLQYVKALAALEELRLGPAQFAIAANGGNLLRRIRRLLGGGDGRRSAYEPGSRFISTSLAVVLVTGFLLFRLATAAEPPPEPVEPAPAPPAMDDVRKQIEQQTRALFENFRNSQPLSDKNMSALKESANELAKSATDAALKSVASTLRKLENTEWLAEEDVAAVRRSANQIAKSVAEFTRKQVEAGLHGNQGSPELSEKEFEKALEKMGDNLGASIEKIVVAAVDKITTSVDKEESETVKGSAQEGAPIKKSFPANAGGHLSMTVDRGSIEVVPGAVDRVDVTVTRKMRGASGEKVDAILAAHEIKFNDGWNNFEIQAAFNKGAGISSKDQSGLQVAYRVSVTKRFDLNLKTAGGEITVGDLEGEIVVATKGGPLSFGQIDGSVDAQTAGGNIKLAGARSKVNLKTAGGQIEAGELGGESSLKTAGGSITVAKSKTKLVAESAGGSITIKEAQNTVKAKTAAGSISAAFAAQPEADCDLITAAGPIRLKISPELSLDISAKTAGGKITSDLDGLESDNSKGGGSLHGTLNKGGRALNLRSGGGNISIDKL